jgi:hypothetical protein
VDIDDTAADTTDDTIQQPGLQTQITAPTPASPYNETVLLAVRSPIPTTAAPRTTRQRSSRESNDGAVEDIESTQPDNLKRRRLDLGELMIKPAVPARPISTKPVELFRQARRPEITRLAETDSMPPPPTKRSMGRGSGKDGRPLVTDLIKAREAEVTGIRSYLTQGAGGGA